MRILVYLPYIPYPLDRGTYQRSFNLLRALAKEHEVDLLALTESGERVEYREVFEKMCRRVEFVPFAHPEWPKFTQRLLDPVPVTIQHWDSPLADRKLDQMIATGNYDMVHLCDIVLIKPFLQRHKSIPLSVDRTRVDLQFQQQQHAIMSSGLKKKLLEKEILMKLARFERRVANRCTMQIVCGPDDETFIRSHISKTVPVKVVVNGVDLEFFTPTSAPDERDPEPTLLFCGAMDYNPNIDALKWFFESVHPNLLASVPNLRVLIVGRNPVAEIEAYASLPGVTVTGGVPDVRPYYRRAWAHIVPLRIGGGTRLKIVESLAMGTPVISTTIGAQGLDLRHGEDILLADTTETFTAETLKALGSQAIRDQIERTGITTAHERFGWPAIGKELSNYYIDTIPSAESRKNRKPPVTILGVPFDNVTTQQTLNIIEGMITSKKPHYLATANVDFAVQAMQDVELRRILMDAHLVLCDGMPLVWASRLLRNPLPERVAGSDLVPALLKVAEKKGHRVFFLGGEEKVALQAVSNVMSTHPNLQVAGLYSPKFAPLLEMDHDDICRRVRESRADILFVSFGCPKQEKWISMHYRNLGVPVSVGVGATIDFLAGNMKRAPRWMQMSGLEWVFRLAQEPRRLFRRYFTDLVWFGSAFGRQLAQSRPQSGSASSGLKETPDGVLTLPKCLDAAQVRRDHTQWMSYIENPRTLVLDGSQVTYVDGTGIGILATVQKVWRHAGHTLVLSDASEPLREMLQLMKLDVLFKQDKEPVPAEHVKIAAQQHDSEVRLSWLNELTAGNLEKVWQPMEKTISFASATNRKRLSVDLSELGFVDSAGVGLMIRTMKQCRQKGLEVQFYNPTDTVRNVIKMLKMEKILLGAA